MTFPIPHPICFFDVSPESEAADRTYDAYLASFPVPVVKAITAAYAKYAGKNNMTDQQIADEMTTIAAAAMATHQAKEAPRLAKAAQAEQDRQAKEQAAQARQAFYANLATVDPTRRATFVGPAIAAARQAAGLTQGELAAALGATQALVSQYERGAMPVPPARLETLAALFGKTVEEFTTPK